MNWNEKFKIIIDDVENHLQRKQDPINTEDIVAIAGCSYDTPTSFTKAFQQFHGLSAKVARQSNIKLSVYSKMKINIKK